MEAPIYRLEGVVKAKEESLTDFVGPLDLILHLLSKNKMEIKDIQISLILEQYMEWMALRKEMDLDVADRITVAYDVPADWQSALMNFKEYICGETLAVELTAGAAETEVDVNGTNCKVTVAKK